MLPKLNGRVMDFLLTRKGKKIPVTSLLMHQVVESSTTEGSKQFQIAQEKCEEVVVKVVMMEELPQEHTDGTKRKMREGYKNISGEDMDITVVVVDEMPTAGTAKRVVISKLPSMSRQNHDKSS